MIRTAALLAVACSAAQAESWLYRVELDPAAPLAARVTVELPAARRAQDFSAQVRGMARHLVPQVSDPRCDGAPLAPDSAGAWRVQGWNCVRLSWTVPLRAADGSGDGLRALESLFDARGGYWVFSEVTSLLRPVGDAAHDGEIDFGSAAVQGSGPADDRQRRVVPDRHEEAGLYVIGDVPRVAVRENDVEAVHVNALGIDLDDLIEQQRRGLRYLMQVMRAHRQFWGSTFVWLTGAEESEPTGVAGFRTLLLSCAVRDGRLQAPELALLMVLRQQFLQMTPATTPLWVRESLAQYYAIKALRHTDLSAEAVSAVERRFVDLVRTPGIRLREAQRRVQSGDSALRDELRHTGAKFWDRVDRAIVRKSGFRTLDSALPRILSARWTDDRLPPAILERLYRYAGRGAIDDLLAMYVGV